MGVLTDYFAATDDELARVDPGLGPDAPKSRPIRTATVLPPGKPKLWQRLSGSKGGSGPASATGEDGRLDVVSLKGIDPVVNMATLAAIVTGDDAMEIIRSRGDDQIEALSTEESWVIRLRSQTGEVLRSLSDDRLPQIAEQWAQTEELQGSRPSDMEEVLRQLRDLAIRAESSGRRLYCWMSL